MTLRSLVALVLLLCVPSFAAAQDWPSRRSHFTAPVTAGGSTAVAARVVGEHLSRQLRQQVVVENKSGANGNVGMEFVAKAAPDGHTVLIGTDAVSSNPHV